MRLALGVIQRGYNCGHEVTPESAIAAEGAAAAVELAYHDEISTAVEVGTSNRP